MKRTKLALLFLITVYTKTTQEQHEVTTGNAPLFNSFTFEI